MKTAYACQDTSPEVYASQSPAWSAEEKVDQRECLKGNLVISLVIYTR